MSSWPPICGCGKRMKQLWSSVYCDCEPVDTTKLCPKCGADDTAAFSLDWYGFGQVSNRLHCWSCGAVWEVD